MVGWIAVGLLVLLGPFLLRRWNVHQARRSIERTPLCEGRFSLVPDNDVPSGIRAGVAPIAAELATLGFVPAGFMAGIELLPELPRHYALFVHPGENAMATAAFSMVVPPVGPSIDFVTLFEDGRWIFTVRARRHLFLADFTSGRLVDAQVATTAQQWDTHRDAVVQAETTETDQAAPPRARRLPSLADLCAFKAARDSEELARAVGQGDVLPTDDPRRFRFTPAGASRFMARTQQGQAQAATLPSDVTYLRIPVEEQERRYRQSLRVQELTRTSPSLRFFLLSAIAFVGSMLLFTSWAWVAMLIPVLLFHELGHFAAMRLLGHRDARIAFIPFLGAATMTSKRFDKRWHEIVVLLAGPLPGIALGLALYALSRALHRPILLGAAGALLAINVLNLLPLVPFDGGRIVHALVTAGRPRVSLLFKLIAAVAFLVGAIWLKEPVFMLLAAVGGAPSCASASSPPWNERSAPSPASRPRAPKGSGARRLRHARPEVLGNLRSLVPDRPRAGGAARAHQAGPPDRRPGRRPLRRRLRRGGRRHRARARRASPGPHALPAPGAGAGGRLRHGPCLGRDRLAAGRADAGAPDAATASAAVIVRRGRLRRCDFDDKDAARALGDRLSEATLVDDYCAAYPWEPAPDPAEERRRTAARASLRKVSEAAAESEGDSAQPTVAALLARDPTIDCDIARLYLTAAEPAPGTRMRGR